MQVNGQPTAPLAADDMAEDLLPPLLSEMPLSQRVASRTGSVTSHSSRSRAQTPINGGPYRRDDIQEDRAKTPTGRTTPTQNNHSSPFNGVPAVPTKEGDGNTVAQLYIVAGLPKDPAVWTLAEEDCVTGVHHMEGAVGRFWRPEILGCSICPSPAELKAKRKGEAGMNDADAERKWEGRTADSSKSTSNPKYIEMSDGRGRVERVETAKVLSKTLKLSFTREVEIVSGQSSYPPAASSHTFSFSVPAQLSVGGTTPYPQTPVKSTFANTSKRDSTLSSAGEGPGSSNGANQQNPGFEDSFSPVAFYGVVLTVWSPADEKRTKAIKRELNRAAKARKGKKGSSNREREEDDDGFLPANNAFFMPYAICIVSKWPLYDLLSDWNKWAWNKYSRNIQKHNQLMSSILATPAPRIGSRLTVESPDGDVAFACTFPGALEWGSGQIAVNLTMWPLFKTLSIDNILTICEVALAPNGRVLFMSRYPALLGLAVETVTHLVEMCGWKGTALQSCHARDVKIYLEDPGNWIVAIASELRSIAKPAKEVCIVDLDINFVKLTHPPKGAPSARGLREKRRRKLVQALGYSTGEFMPPREYIEAYPAGRFRPLSKMITRSTTDEQLEAPAWWDQAKVVAGFDKALHDGTRPSPLARLLRMRAAKNHTTSESELAALAALRNRADTFVDARDGLENKIGRLNKRLAFLMSESEMWKVQFAKISQLVERLTKEANETRAKLEKERRESRRLSSTLAQRDMERLALEIQLKETEDARVQAQAELSTMQRAMDSLEHEREAMMNEIRGIVSGAGGDEDIAFNTSRMELYNESVGHASGISSATSHASMTPSQAAERILKARKAAEDRINEGRPGGGRSRAPTASIAHSDADRDKTSASPLPSMLGGNHSNEDQMNYEIQRRTMTVTNQIARIQAQLENTLSSLEDRKSVSQHHHRSRSGSGRARRDSDLSMESGARYEHRAPSSLGGGHIMSDADASQTSATGVGDDAGTELDSAAQDGGYSSTASASAAGAAADARRRERREARRQRAIAAESRSAGGAGSGTASPTLSPESSLRRRVTTNAGPPSSYRGPIPSGLGTGSVPMGKTASAPSTSVSAAGLGSSSSSFARDNWQPHQQLQERERHNAWKTSSATSETHHAQPQSPSAPLSPRPVEVVGAEALKKGAAAVDTADEAGPAGLGPAEPLVDSNGSNSIDGHHAAAGAPEESRLALSPSSELRIAEGEQNAPPLGT